MFSVKKKYSGFDVNNTEYHHIPSIFHSRRGKAPKHGHRSAGFKRIHSNKHTNQIGGNNCAVPFIYEIPRQTLTDDETGQALGIHREHWVGLQSTLWEVFY